MKALFKEKKNFSQYNFHDWHIINTSPESQGKKILKLDFNLNRRSLIFFIKILTITLW